jgi:hypothetical protein
MLKWRQEKERRDSLLKRAEAVLLDRKEWQEREQLVKSLVQQEQEDFTERDAVLEHIAKLEGPAMKLRQMLEIAKEQEELQCAALRDRDQELRNLRAQVHDRENQLIDDEGLFVDKTEELKATMGALQKMEVDITSHLDTVHQRANAVSERHAQVAAQLEVATLESDRLSNRVPARYQSELVESEARDFVREESAVRQLVEESAASDVDSHVGSQTAEAAPKAVRSKPVVGMEVRAENNALRVVSVTTGGAAALAGFRVGDTIRMWNGRAVATKLAYSKALVASGVGNPVTVEVSRARGTGRSETVTLTVIAKPSRTSSRSL